MFNFNIFKKKNEEIPPEIKGSRYLSDINAVLDPVNEQTPQLVRMMGKFKEIIDDPSDWKMITNTYDRGRSFVNSDGFKISVTYQSYIERIHSFRYKYLVDYYYISFHTATDDYVFDHTEIINSHFVWNSYIEKKKQTEEGIIIGKCFSIFEKIEEEKKQKKDDELRRKFYKQV